MGDQKPGAEEKQVRGLPRYSDYRAAGLVRYEYTGMYCQDLN